MFVLMCGALVPARAQDPGDKIELSAGYAYMHFKSSPSVNLNGFALSGQYKLRDWLGGVGEVGGEYGTVGGVSSRVYTFLVGPQISWPRRVSPFAHILLGAGTFSGGGFANRSLAVDYGVGVDCEDQTQMVLARDRRRTSYRPTSGAFRSITLAYRLAFVFHF